MLKSNSSRHGDLNSECTSCSYNLTTNVTSFLWDMETPFRGTTQNWINECTTNFNNGWCPQCQSGHVVSSMSYDTAPPLIAINIEGQKVPIEHSVSVPVDSTHTGTYKLCGIIYLGDFHFVAKIIDKKSNNIWYYDGASSNATKGFKERTLKEINAKSLLKHK